MAAVAILEVKEDGSEVEIARTEGLTGENGRMTMTCSRTWFDPAPDTLYLVRAEEMLPEDYSDSRYMLLSPARKSELQALRSSADSPGAWVLLAQYAYDCAQLELAIEAAREAQKLRPDPALGDWEKSLRAASGKT